MHDIYCTNNQSACEREEPTALRPYPVICQCVRQDHGQRGVVLREHNHGRDQIVCTKAQEDVSVAPDPGYETR